MLLDLLRTSYNGQKVSLSAHMTVLSIHNGACQLSMCQFGIITTGTGLPLSNCPTRFSPPKCAKIHNRVSPSLSVPNTHPTRFLPRTCVRGWPALGASQVQLTWAFGSTNPSSGNARGGERPACLGSVRGVGGWEKEGQAVFEFGGFHPRVWRCELRPALSLPEYFPHPVHVPPPPPLPPPPEKVFHRAHI